MRNTDRLEAPIRAMSRTPSQEFLGPSGGGFRPGGRPGAGAAGAQRAGPAPPAVEARRTPLNLAPKTGSAQLPPLAAKPAMGEPETRTKATSIIREWLGPNRDTAEATDLFQALVDAKADLSVAVDQWFSDAVELRGTDWAAVGELLVLMAVDKKLLPAADAAKALRTVLDSMEDLRIDAPKAPEHAGTLIGALVVGGVLDLKPMAQHILTAGPPDAEADEPPALVDSGVALKVLGAVMRQVSEKKGDAAMLSAWQSAGLELEAFLPEHDRQDKEHLKREVAKAGLQLLLPGAPVDEGIAELLGKGESAAAVDEWVEGNVSSAALAEQPFVRAFMLGVLRGTISDPASLDVSQPLPALADGPTLQLLLRYVGTRKPGVQLAAVFAVQQFFQEASSRKGLMRRLLQDLYQGEVLREETYTKWRDDVKDQTPGKVQAITDVSAWLQELAEQEEEED